jgi:subtilisin family serine protease
MSKLAREFAMGRIIKALTIVGLLLTFSTVNAQGSPTEVGIAPPGQNALELIGQINQSGFNLTAYGYVTDANGLDSNLLFAEGTNAMLRSEQTARLTYYGTGIGISRAVHENIFASVVTATLTFYWNDVPAEFTFDDPASFEQGTPVATLTLRLHSLLNVQEPNVGVLSTVADASQDSAEVFMINGQSYQLGHPGLTERFTLFGQGFRSSTEPLAAQYRFAGNAVLTGSAP